MANLEMPPQTQLTQNSRFLGMGELHLEIIRDRILKEYKVDADLGPLQIAYREAPLDSVTESMTMDIKIGSHKNHVLVTMSLVPTANYVSEDLLKFDKNAENASNIAAIYPKHLQAIRQGVQIGLAQGPKINSQVSDFVFESHL